MTAEQFGGGGAEATRNEANNSRHEVAALTRRVSIISCDCKWPGGEFNCSVEKSVDFSVEIYCTKKLNL